MRSIITALLVLLSVDVSLAQEFEIKTTDGTTELTGVVDIPKCKLESYPAVVIVGGTGLFYRNGYFGRSGTESDFVFLDLARRLNQACIAAVRFDYRGVHCDITGPTEAKECLDQEVRKGVTVESKLSDIEQIVDYASSHPDIDSDKIVMFGHSEGSLNISKLVAQKRISPKALLFMGGVTESIQSLLHWQFVGRGVTWAFELDQNQDGILTNEEVRAEFPKARFADVLPIEAFLSPTGSWTKESLESVLQNQYDRTKQDALSHADEAVYLARGFVFASYGWWKQFFRDDVSVLENLREFSGPIVYHNGTTDSQTPGTRELEYLLLSDLVMVSEPSFVLHPHKGHSLGNSPLYGPIDELMARQIIGQIKTWVR